MPKKKQTRKKVQEAKKADATKQHLKKAKIRHNVRGATTHAWKTYERVWAEDGVIKIQAKDSDEIEHLSPRDAALRAQIINKMLANPKMPFKERQENAQFVSKIIEIIKEAKYQNEAPSTQNEKMIANVLAGKTAEGEDIKPITDPEEMMKYLSFKYPMLSEQEIEQVFTAKDVPLHEKTGILQTINADRLMELVQKQEAYKQQQGY